MKKTLTILLSCALLFCIFAGCSSEKTPAGEDLPEVSLRIAGTVADSSAVEWAAAAFKEQYPNCTITYEYLQGEYSEALLERTQSEGDERIDLFITTTGIQGDHDLLDCAYDLSTLEGLDLSHTFPSLIENAKYVESDGSPATKLYCIPFGAEMRGLYVNLSLLRSVGINSVPKNQAELLEACETLKQAGYIPFQGDIGIFAQQLLYPWICNNIANAENPEEVYELVNSRDPAACEYFRDVYEFMYTLVEKGYYDYVGSREKFGLFIEGSSESYVRALLNIVETSEGSGEFVAGEGAGNVAFEPQALSLKTTFEHAKEDYHSEVEYTFIPAPVGVDGGYVYMSPSNMIAVSKTSEKLPWVTKFLNFLFTPENNETFAEKYSVLPNTDSSFSYVSNLFDVPTNHISELGQATFDWSFYRTLTRNTSDELRALPAISKANNPKYLDPATGEMYSFDHFWQQFVAEFTGE